jgi:regulator of sigma E protease
MANPPVWAIIFWGLLTFSLLVVIHEGGHFFAARRFGIRVHEFMLGLPGPSLKWRSKKSGTYYGATAIPLGGYVRIAGMEPGAEDELLGSALKVAAEAGTVDADRLADALQIGHDRAVSLLVTLDDWGSIEKDPAEQGRYRALVTADPDTDSAELLSSERIHTYRGLKTWQRVTVLSMGVLMNLITAILLFTVTLSVFGIPEATLRIDTVEKASPAARAGLKAGDVIAAIDGAKVKDWQAFLTDLGKRKPGDTIRLTVSRSRTPVTVTAILAESAKRPFLGVRAKVENVRPDPLAALGMSLQWTGLVFVGVAQFFNPATFQQSVQGARSVVGISVETARAASAGALQYVWIVALLSLSLGVVNILPIPPLDGGKIAMELVERVMRKPIPRAVSLGVSLVGALLLFSLIGYLMFSDVARMVAGRG